MNETLEQLKARRDSLRAMVTQAKESLHYLAFIPNDAQVDFMRDLDRGMKAGKRQFGAFFGNRCGKSVLSVNLIWNIVMEGKGTNPFFAQFDWIRKWPFDNKRIRLLCNSDQLKEYRGAIWSVIQEWWPQGMYEALKQGMDYPSLYKLPNGWTLDICTYDQAAERHESVELSLVMFDEPPLRSLWYAYAMRLSKGGIRIIFATILFESDWIEPELIQNPDFMYTYADIEKNCKEHAKVGYLSHEEVERMIAMADPAEREARRTGHPMSGGRRLFNIVPAVHFIPREQCPSSEDSGETVLALDPHQRRYFAITVLKKLNTGGVCVVDEWPRENYLALQGTCPMTLAEYAQLITDLKNKWRINDYNCVIDAKFGKQALRTNYDVTTLIQAFENDFGLWFTAGVPNLLGESGSISVLKSLLRFNPEKPVDFCNTPGLHVADDLYNTCTGLRNVSWKIDAHERVDDKYLDFPRCVMYAVMHMAVDTTMNGADPTVYRDKKLLEQLREQGEIV